MDNGPEPSPGEPLKPAHVQYSHRTPEQFDKEAARTTVVSARSVIYGVAVFAALLLGAWTWRLSSTLGSRRPPQPFEFNVEAPEPEDFELADPIRDILVEKPEDMPDEMEPEEKPDIHVTAVPIEELVTREVVQTPNVQIDTTDIDVTATELDVQDAPEEITEDSLVTEYALQPISVASPDYADIYKYKQPHPPDKPLRYVLNRARGGRALKVLPKQFGEQDAPSMGRLGPANVNLFGTGDFFRTMTRFGGVRAKSAVDSALHWLAVHQEPDGLWNAKKHEGSEQADQAVTALATLAFMGGGHTIRKGEYRRNVLRGLEAILRSQKADGGILRGGRMYGHALCTIALCEAYGRARDERIGLAARKAVLFCEKAVNPDGGWRYTPNCGVSDMSVSPWLIQALKTARLAHIKFDNAVFSRALLYVDSCTDQGATKNSNGAVNYQFQPDQDYGQGNPALTAAAMLVRQFSGMGVKNHLLVKGAGLTRKQAPNWSSKDFYLWYYATYAMHNMGGENRIWWNRRIRDVLIENQCKTGDNAGSWDPEGSRWGTRGGRVYTTALGALCLEVYYRYSEALTSFGVAPDLDELFLQ